MTNVDQDQKSMPINQHVCSVYQVSSLLTMVVANNALSICKHQTQVLPSVIHVVVVRKSMLIVQVVTNVWLVNTLLMMASVKTVQSMKSH